MRLPVSGQNVNVETIHLTIPSRLELLPLVDQLAEGICQRLDFSDEDCASISISVLEAGTNAIQHGNHTDASKCVDMAFEIHPDRLEVRVSDVGSGFDLARMEVDITSPEHLLDLRGRGIYMMRNCMDQVNFSFTPRGTTVRLVKARRASVNGKHSAA